MRQQRQVSQSLPFGRHEERRLEWEVVGFEPRMNRFAEPMMRVNRISARHLSRHEFRCHVEVCHRRCLGGRTVSIGEEREADFPGSVLSGSTCASNHPLDFNNR